MVEIKLRERKLFTFLIIFIGFSMLIYAATYVDDTEAEFNLGTYSATEYNSSGFIELAINDSNQNLPANGVDDGNVNMSGNMLLLHFDNDASYGENDTYVYDFSGNGNNGTWSGDASPDGDSGPNSTGKLGGSFMFDGDDYIIGDFNQGTSNYTISVWMKPTILTGVRGCAGYTLADGTRVDIYHTSNEVRLFYPDGGGSTDYVITTSSPIQSTNEWYHLAGTYNGTTAKIYVNGVDTPIGSPANAGTYTANKFWVGRIAPDGDYEFGGAIDEVSIWNRPLSSEEVEMIYNRQSSEYALKGTYSSQIFNPGSDSQWLNISWSESGIGALPDNGVVEPNGANMTDNILLYHFDETAANLAPGGLDVEDFSGKGFHGTEAGGVTFGSTGKHDSALTFNGGNDKVTASLGTLNAPFSIEAWCYFDNLNQPAGVYDYCFSLGTSPNMVSYSRFAATNTFYSYSEAQVRAGPVLTGQQWLHMATIYDTSAPYHRLFINGEEVSVDDFSAAINTNGELKLGVWETSWWHDGLIDDFAIYNRTITPVEIRNSYNRGLMKLNASVRSCDDASCDGESWTDINDTSPQQLALGNNSYFQYQFEFNGTGNATPSLSNVTMEYNLIPTLDHYYIETYENNQARSHFANGTKIELRTNVTGTATPTVTVTDSEGTIWVNGDNMVNVSNIFVYNYTLNGSQGWYDVKVNSQDWYKTFYQSQTWQSNYTDEDGNPFSFRRKINVTEPGTRERFFEPVDIPVNFSYEQANNSVRVLAYNGSTYLEIPSQIYNTNQTGTTLYSSNVVFLSSLNQSETREYYIVSSKTANNKAYTTDIIYSNTSDFYTISNSYSTSYFNTSTGGLMQNAFASIGTNLSLYGLHPMDYYPEYQIGLTTYSSRADTSVTTGNVEGPVLYLFNVSGQSSDDSSKPYTYNCKIYSKNYQIICEKNQTTTANQDWKNFNMNGLIVEDELFSLSAYENSSNIITNGSLTTVSNLDQNMKWISFYDNTLGNAIGEIFLNNTFETTNNPSFSIADDSGYDYYQQIVIDSTAQSVASNDYFYTKTARVIYNGLREYEFIDQMYDNLQNPVIIGQAFEETSDSNNPYYTSNASIATNDQSDLTFYSYWIDDSFLDYAIINITGPGMNGTATHLYQNLSSTIRNGTSVVNASSVNITLNSTYINAGNVSCNITAYDISGKYNSTVIIAEVSDLTPPSVEQVLNNPNTTNELDPNKTIEINVTLFEYSTLDKVNLYYRNNNSGSWSSWSNETMTNIVASTYNYTYATNITPSLEAAYQYYIAANDTDSNAANSSTYNLSVYFDYTWTIIDNLTANSGVFDTNISLGNLTLNNTGDYDLTFTGSAGVFGSRIYINGSQASTNPQFEVENGTSVELNITGTTRESGQTEGTDSVTITFSNSSANPTSDTASVSLITISGGPFLHTEITNYNQTVNLGDVGVGLTAKVTNLGNETATNTNITFVLPTGWDSGQDLLTSALGTLTVGSYGEYSISVNVDSSASAGAQTVTANSICAENKTGSTYVTITVVDPNAGGTESSGDTGGSSGGGGGGGGGASLSVEESNRFFSSEDSFELVRGEDQKFTIPLENPYDDAVIENLRITLQGFSKDYIFFYPGSIARLGVGEKEDITVEITAPGYFTQGQYDLEFTFKGKLVKINTSKTIDFMYTKDITLHLFDVSRADATDYKIQAEEYLQDMIAKGYITKDAEDLFQQLSRNYNITEFGIVKDIFEQIEELYEAAVDSDEGIQELEEAVGQARAKNINVEETERLVHLAKSSFERGDFLVALERVKEAKLTLAIESSGKFFKEMQYAMRENPGETTAGFGAFGVSVVGLSLFTRWRYIKRKLKKLGEEENLLTELMKAVQIEVFEKAKMSMKEYGDSMMQYEERLGNIIGEKITFQNKKDNLLKFKPKGKKLLEERNQLVEIMKETQEAYITKGKFETRIYENMLKSYSERLTDVEEKLALVEVKRAKKGSLVRGSE